MRPLIIAVLKTDRIDRIFTPIPPSVPPLERSQDSYFSKKFRSDLMKG